MEAEQVETSGTEVTTEGKKRRLKSDGVSMSTTILIAVLSSTLAVGCYDRFFAQKIVVADIEGYVKKVEGGMRTGQISVQEMANLLDAAKANIDKVPKRKVVVLGSVVASKGIEHVELPELKIAATDEMLVPDGKGGYAVEHRQAAPK